MNKNEILDFMKYGNIESSLGSNREVVINKTTYIKGKIAMSKMQLLNAEDDLWLNKISILKQENHLNVYSRGYIDNILPIFTYESIDDIIKLTFRNEVGQYDSYISLYLNKGVIEAYNTGSGDTKELNDSSSRDIAIIKNKLKQLFLSNVKIFKDIFMFNQALSYNEQFNILSCNYSILKLINFYEDDTVQDYMLSETIAILQKSAMSKCDYITLKQTRIEEDKDRYETNIYDTDMSIYVDIELEYINEKVKMIRNEIVSHNLINNNSYIYSKCGNSYITEEFIINIDTDPLGGGAAYNCVSKSNGNNISYGQIYLDENKECIGIGGHTIVGHYKRHKKAFLDNNQMLIQKMNEKLKLVSLYHVEILYCEISNADFNEKITMTRNNHIF